MDDTRDQTDDTRDWTDDTRGWTDDTTAAGFRHVPSAGTRVSSV